jgi:hypothetical protein
MSNYIHPIKKCAKIITKLSTVLYIVIYIEICS